MLITYKVLNQDRQITFDDLFDNFSTVQAERTTAKRTFTKVASPNYRPSAEIYTAMLAGITEAHTLIEPFLREDMSEHYESFLISKASGGMRRIDAPKQEFKDVLKRIKEIFEYKLHVLHHDAAYAYVKERSCKEALQQHQNNQSKWFLKMDIKDFFPSCEPEFIMHQLNKLYPFHLLFKDPLTRRKIHAIIEGCTLNNGLPQGTPMSPILTNLLMLPIDVAIQNTFKDFNGNRFVYTRYADDLLLSCQYTFNWREVQEYINSTILEISPFQIKAEKTRYGSSAGRNWNLGLMLNKDNNITIGHKKKERFKAALHNFIKDYDARNYWSIEDTMVFQGMISYYKQIEPEWIKDTIKKYETKPERVLPRFGATSIIADGQPAMRVPIPNNPLEWDIGTGDVTFTAHYNTVTPQIVWDSTRQVWTTVQPTSANTATQITTPLTLKEMLKNIINGKVQRCTSDS